MDPIANQIETIYLNEELEDIERKLGYGNLIECCGLIMSSGLRFTARMSVLPDIHGCEDNCVAVSHIACSNSVRTNVFYGKIIIYQTCETESGIRVPLSLTDAGRNYNCAVVDEVPDQLHHESDIMHALYLAG